ncbi:MAG: hypothetical protein WD267_05220 [Balneolales bacterium]
MLKKEHTKLEVFGFSDQPEDKFYCLLDTSNKSAGIDIKKLSSTKPEKLDEALNKMGCLVLLSNNDINNRLDLKGLEHDELHDRLFNWASEEGMF